MESTEVQYRHNKMMGEISGFGGGYEECCQDMLEAGVKWLTAHNNAKLDGHTFKGVYGVFVPDSDNAKELERVVLEAADGQATGAMHHAVMDRLFYIASNGWESYVAELSSNVESAEGTA